MGEREGGSRQPRGLPTRGRCGVWGEWGLLVSVRGEIWAFKKNLKNPREKGRMELRQNAETTGGGNWHDVQSAEKSAFGLRGAAVSTGRDQRETAMVCSPLWTRRWRKFPEEQEMRVSRGHKRSCWAGASEETGWVKTARRG